MIGMAEYPDKYFELAIVDPQYGLDIIKQWGEIKHGYKQYASKEWDKAIPDASYFTELFRVSKNQIICGGNYFAQYLPASQGWVVWNKMQREFSMADGELAWTSFDRALRIFDMSRGECVAQNGDRFHPTQKPVKLYKWLLDKYAKQGDKILDTHLGSGSSRIACYDYGFDFTGFELDKDYFEAQEKRFNDHISQTNLFK